MTTDIWLNSFWQIVCYTVHGISIGLYLGLERMNFVVMCGHDRRVKDEWKVFYAAVTKIHLTKSSYGFLVFRIYIYTYLLLENGKSFSRQIVKTVSVLLRPVPCLFDFNISFHNGYCLLRNDSSAISV